MFPYRVKYTDYEPDIQNNDLLYKIDQQCLNTFEHFIFSKMFKNSIVSVISINWIIHILHFFVFCNLYLFCTFCIFRIFLFFASMFLVQPCCPFLLWDLVLPSRVPSVSQGRLGGEVCSTAQGACTGPTT